MDIKCNGTWAINVNIRLEMVMMNNEVYRAKNVNNGLEMDMINNDITFSVLNFAV